MSPLNLVLGQHVHGPIDLSCLKWLPSKETAMSDIEWIQEYCRDLQDLHALAATNNRRTQEQVNELADMLAKERTFELGDLVLVFTLVEEIARSPCVAAGYKLGHA